MKKIILACILGVSALFLSGCDFPNQTDQSRTTPSTPTPQQQIGNYDLQSKCAGEAKAYFSSEWSNNPEASYIDHYNKSLNKCFIEVTLDIVGNTEYKDIFLTDVQEKTLVGGMNATYPIGQMPQILTHCEINKQKCTSVDEFNKLINIYMSN